MTERLGPLDEQEIREGLANRDRPFPLIFAEALLAELDHQRAEVERLTADRDHARLWANFYQAQYECTDGYRYESHSEPRPESSDASDGWEVGTEVQRV